MRTYENDTEEIVLECSDCGVSALQTVYFTGVGMDTHAEFECECGVLNEGTAFDLLGGDPDSLPGGHDWS